MLNIRIAMDKEIEKDNRDGKGRRDSRIDPDEKFRDMKKENYRL